MERVLTCTHNQAVLTTEHCYLLQSKMYKARGAYREPRDLCTIGVIEEKQNPPLNGKICWFIGECRGGTTSRVRGKS